MGWKKPVKMSTIQEEGRLQPTISPLTTKLTHQMMQQVADVNGRGEEVISRLGILATVFYNDYLTLNDGGELSGEVSSK